MYLELHRGTLTSQLRTKQGNRRAEQLLHEVELWAATAAVRIGADYPYDDLERIWQRVLLLQFHDILSGSSIAWVHREAEAEYAALTAELRSLTDDALTALCGQGDSPIVVNSASVEIGGIPALSARPPRHIEDRATVTETAAGWRLANGMLSLEVDRRGLIVSLRDASGREAIAPGAAGNLLRLHRDLPDKWEAWDIDRHYRHSSVDLVDVDEITAEEVDGAAVLRCMRSFGDSTATQTISLAPGRAAVDLAVELDWHERHRLLKLLFPLDVHAEYSTAEVQFGHVHRPTHTNTSWDEAKFEFPAQRWIHVGEAGYGVAMANDSTHGHSVERETRVDGGTTTTIGLSVVRAPTFPDPGADQGYHVVHFALRPGAGLREAREEGRRLAAAVRPRNGSQGIEPLLTSSDPDVLIETVKLAEDRSGDVVARLYEASGGRRTTVITASFSSGGVAVSDLLERPLVDQARIDGQDTAALTLTLRPFEVLTIRYEMTGDPSVSRAPDRAAVSR
jgi:alpha-mannosidase